MVIGGEGFSDFSLSHQEEAHGIAKRIRFVGAGVYQSDVGLKLRFIDPAGFGKRIV